jgi:hypothetical protein
VRFAYLGYASLKKIALTLLFDAVASLPADEQRVVHAVFDGLIVRTRQLAEQHTMPAGG